MKEHDCGNSLEQIAREWQDATNTACGDVVPNITFYQCKVCRSIYYKSVEETRIDDPLELYKGKLNADEIRKKADGKGYSAARWIIEEALDDQRDVPREQRQRNYKLKMKIKERLRKNAFQKLVKDLTIPGILQYQSPSYCIDSLLMLEADLAGKKVYCAFFSTGRFPFIRPKNPGLEFIGCSSNPNSLGSWVRGLLERRYLDEFKEREIYSKPDFIPDNAYIIDTSIEDKKDLIVLTNIREMSEKDREQCHYPFTDPYMPQPFDG